MKFREMRFITQAPYSEVSIMGTPDRDKDFDTRSEYYDDCEVKIICADRNGKIHVLLERETSMKIIKLTDIQIDAILRALRLAYGDADAWGCTTSKSRYKDASDAIKNQINDKGNKNEK